MGKIREQPVTVDGLRKAYGLKPITRRTGSRKKLERQRGYFKSKHKCPACGAEMDFVEGTNIMVCSNPSCKSHGEEFQFGGSERFYHLLDETGAEIANNIFEG